MLRACDRRSVRRRRRAGLAMVVPFPCSCRAVPHVRCDGGYSGRREPLPASIIYIYGLRSGHRSGAGGGPETAFNSPRLPRQAGARRFSPRMRASGPFARTTVHGVVPPPLADSLPPTAACPAPAVRAVLPRGVAALWAVLRLMIGRAALVVRGCSRWGYLPCGVAWPRGAARGTSYVLRRPFPA